MEMATAFHDSTKVSCPARADTTGPPEVGVTEARLKLVSAAKIVLARALDLMA